MITIFGIRNCDTMKKARSWLDNHGVGYRFHDYKSEGIDQAHLAKWIASEGLDVVLNRAGTTFRKLTDEDKANLSKDKAIALMIAQPSLIKRPVLEANGAITIGFKPELYEALFSSSR
ncbi:ArsC family reductase [Rhizobium sp. FKY42]|uniref:ArsC family reductase n=1 Tax=Rhizobium sp. FKY42 TaxID=2562310 RepID=UPI0010BFA8EC|nr:ArsC family reductase [Rhizobium sp. FKY42]